MQSFLVVFREYPTCDLIFLCIHTRLKARVYTISRYTTQKHCITSMYILPAPHIFLYVTGWESLFKHPDMFSLVMNSFILMTCLFE